MTQNTVETVFAAPVSVNVEFGTERITLLFRRITLNDKLHYFSKYGKQDFLDKLADVDHEVTFDVLWRQLTIESKKDIIAAKGWMVDIDKDGKEIYLAEKPFDIMVAILNPDLESLALLIMELSGIPKKTIEEYNSLPDKKKELILSQMKEQTSQESRDSSESTQENSHQKSGI